MTNLEALHDAVFAVGDLLDWSAQRDVALTARDYDAIVAQLERALAVARRCQGGQGGAKEGA